MLFIFLCFGVWFMLAQVVVVVQCVAAEVVNNQSFRSGDVLKRTGWISSLQLTDNVMNKHLS